MWKLLKYELKETYKFAAAASIMIIIVNIFFIIYSRKDMMSFGTSMESMFMCDFLALFVMVINMTNFFQKELYGDRGYLTFTLPVKGKEILGAKLITALIWIGLICSVVCVFTIIFFNIIVDRFIRNYVNFDLNNFYIKGVILSILLWVFLNIIVLIIIWFSITLSRTTIKNKKVSSLLSFVIFIVLIVVSIIVQAQLVKLFPQMLTVHLKNVSDSSIYCTKIFQISPYCTQVNVASLIFNITLGTVLFVLSAYLIDNKIEI